MSVRIAYDDPADPMDPAMEGHAEQLRRIDTEDARRHQAREALTGAPRTVVPHGEGPSSSGGRPLPPPGAPAYLTESDLPALLAEVERELPDAVAERIAEGHARLLAHGRRVHADYGAAEEGR